jgi:hypothetical protein
VAARFCAQMSTVHSGIQELSSGVAASVILPECQPTQTDASDLVHLEDTHSIALPTHIAERRAPVGCMPWIRRGVRPLGFANCFYDGNSKDMGIAPERGKSLD